MKIFNNFGKTEDYKPIVRLSDGRYLVSFNKVLELKEEKVLKNSRYVATGKMLPTGNATWQSIYFDYQPSLGKIKDTLFEIINDDTNYAIENCFVWKGLKVHLTLENQMNYKASFDLAIATNGESLPATFKFSKNGKPEYFTFDNINELKSFYVEMNSFINSCLQKGWKKKDQINLDDYKI